MQDTAFDPLAALKTYHAAIDVLDFAAIEACFAPAACYVSDGVGATVVGREAILAAFRSYFACYGDQVSKDEQVAALSQRSAWARWRLEATHAVTGARLLRSGEETVFFDADGRIMRVEVKDDVSTARQRSMMRAIEASQPNAEAAMKAAFATAILPLLVTPALAGTAVEAVKPFYDHVGLELDPAERGRFVDPAKAVLDARDQLEKSEQGDCLDANMPLDSAVYDKAELDKSLKIIGSETGDSAIVVAAFTAAGEPHRMQWKLKKVDGEWKVADLLSVTNEWALSQYQCQ